MSNANSRSRDSRLGAFLPLIALAAITTTTGCGDGPICQSEVLVIIQSPSGPVLVDSNLTSDGIQTDVRIRSTVGEGVEVTLEVLDDDEEVIAEATGTTDADGDVTIEDVDLPDGAVQLRAFVDAGECGSDEDIVDVEIAVGGDCEVAFRQEPLDIAFYDPFGVLNRSLDTDDVEDDFQGQIDVTTRGGFDVELFVLDGTSGLETSAGTATADGTGEASFDVTLGQGRQTVRAVCSSGAASTASDSTTVFVDTEAPACAMTFPVAGTTITPAMDDDADLGNGVQLTLEANAAGGDTEGEAASFVVTVDGTDTTLAGSPIDAAGDTQADATIDPASAPAVVSIELTAADHAENGCAVTEDYDVVYDGCSIEVVSPLDTVTVDADGDGSNGAQIDVVLDIDPACAGRPVTSDCGSNDPGGTVAGDGSLTLTVDMCGTVPCDAQDTCTITVTNTDGIETSVGAMLDYDDEAPAVSLLIVDPSVICPATVAAGDDTNGALAGVQIVIRVDSPLATTRTLEQTDGSGTQSFDATSDVEVTLASGTTSFVGIAVDDVGNSASTPSCDVTLDDDDITDLTVVGDTRQSLRATWTAPSGAASYILKYSTTALTEANFDSTGTVVPTGAPQSPGLQESYGIAPLRTGTDFWVGVAAVDGGGMRGPASIVGPVRPLFDQTGAILPTDTTGDAHFGLTLARGKFNDDDLWDVAVAAPVTNIGALTAAGVVYVYFGSASGIADVPDVVIEGTTDFGNFGLAMTAVRWSSATRDDLVIGEPFADGQNGRAYIYNGGAGFIAGTFDTTDADVTIGVHAAANYFTGGALGWSLAGPDFDGDGIDDLAIGSVVGGSGNGGIALIYGGTVSGTSVNLSNLDSSQLSGAVVHLLDDPDTTAFDLFGNYAFDVGPTESAGDPTDDLVVSYGDAANRILVYRGTTVRPMITGVFPRPFTVGLDVRINYQTADTLDEFGSAAGSISDQNGDGARDIVTSAHREGTDRGAVFIIDGNTVGTGGEVTIFAPDATLLTSFFTPSSEAMGSAIVNNATSPGADVDGDGLEDLLFTERRGGLLHLVVWFGGTIPVGAVSTENAPHVISGPSTFSGLSTGFGGTAHAATWVGDVNGDGLSDICWGDGVGNGRDGSVEVLWDDGN